VSESARARVERDNAAIRVWQDKLRPVLDEAGRSVIGRRELFETLLIALACEGHVLIEGAPGLAKTLAARTFAALLDLDFGRIQFTPDLLPSDLTGTPVYHPPSGSFRTRKGPVFTQTLLADEINRAPAKVQAALLEAMEERQVTLGEETFELPRPFMVLATQNPLEQEGTYPLPEAQLDRFLFKLVLDYPDRETERTMLRVHAEGEPPPPASRLTIEDIEGMRSAARTVHLDDRLTEWILDLAGATRDPEGAGLADIAPLVAHGVSPRGCLQLTRASRVFALVRGRSYVTPDDILTLIYPCWRHRIIPGFDAEAAGIPADEILRRIIAALPQP